MKLDALVFVSDTHCGSTCGIMPYKFTMHDGHVVHANAAQRWLWDCWNHDIAIIRRWVGGRNAGLVIVGDATEGCHHRTVEVVSADEGDHKEIAKAVFSPLRKLFAKAWIVEGTECHTKRMESSIGMALNCEPYRKPKGKQDHGVFAWPELPLEVNGCYGIARHHITTSLRPWTEMTGIHATKDAEILEAAKCSARVPRWFVYAHRHKFGYVNDGDSLAVVCNPWQALTRHGSKVVGHARYIKPGMVMLDFADMQDGLPTVRRTKHAPHSIGIVRA